MKLFVSFFVLMFGVLCLRQPLTPLRLDWLGGRTKGEHQTTRTSFDELEFWPEKANEGRTNRDTRVVSPECAVAPDTADIRPKGEWMANKQRHACRIEEIR